VCVLARCEQERGKRKVERSSRIQSVRSSESVMSIAFVFVYVYHCMCLCACVCVCVCVCARACACACDNMNSHVLLENHGVQGGEDS